MTLPSPRQILALLSFCLFAAYGTVAVAAPDPSVFDSKPAEFAPDIFGDRQKTDGTLRILTVDERMGYPRKREIVRVPVFFHAAEASADPNAFAITPAGGGDPVPYQADDIRRDASGKIARMHLYFVLDDLPAWGRKQFHLKAGKNPAGTHLTAKESDGKVTLAGEDIKITFNAAGNTAGSIAAIETTAGKVSIPEQNLGPSAKIIRQPTNAAPASRENEILYTQPDSLTVKSIQWASGPVFAKLAVRLSPRGAPEDIAEYVYFIPRHGSEFSLTQMFYPDGGDTVETVGTKSNTFLYGKIILGDSEADQQILSIPAGVRRELRSVFKFANKVLVNAKAGISLAMVPYTQQGGRDVGVDEAGRTFFRGSYRFQTVGGSNSHSLRVFWGQTRFIFSNAVDTEALWQQQCQSFQSLTAVVDEPWATPADLNAFARDVCKEYGNIKHWGRSFSANLAMDYLGGKDVSARLAGGSETAPDIRPMIPTREEIEAAFKNGQKGAGALDPYQITYDASAIVLFSAFLQPSKKLDEMAFRLGQAGRLINDATTPEGWPNIRSFANTANMKIGTMLCALWAGNRYKDADLTQWARDGATSQNLLTLYGRSQRPYNISVGIHEDSDLLYMSITDSWLRAMELAGNEDLSIHPGVYGRYFDMVDVNADIYQKKPLVDKATKQLTGFQNGWWRAVFFRGQSHDHRWEAWGTSPTLGALGRASDKGQIGITEACYFMQKEVGKPQSWNNLMTDVFFPAILTTRGIQNYKPASRPALPQNVQVDKAGGRNVVTWDAVPGAEGYRIYRAQNTGGPWKWVNSPWLKLTKFQPPTNAEKAEWQTAAATENEEKAKTLNIAANKLKQADKVQTWQKMPPIVTPPLPNTLVKETTFADPDGTPDSIYFVTAQDKEGRESRWFPHEPLPAPSEP
ncbi:hypothetical protein DB346_00680 [Verrucomicrobia bacterium LW23]|nr:hypothetical protein DB346_00680 [Verrucomicrobia bacterium LW23]